MEDNKINENINLANEKSSVIKIEKQTATVGIQSDTNLTNEQKLEYISKLIQDAEKNLESNGISKKLIK